MIAPQRPTGSAGRLAMLFGLPGVLTALLAAAAFADGPPLTALAFSPGGDSLVSGSTRGVVVRSADSLAVQNRIDTECEHVHDARFSPDGRQLAVVGGVPAESGLVEVFEWPAGDRRRVWHVGADVVYAVDWLPDSTGVVLAGFDGTAALLGLDDDEPVVAAPGHSRSVTGICLIPTGEPSGSRPLILTGSVDQTLRVWDFADSRTLRTLHNHTGPVHAVALRPLERGLPMVASIADDRTVRFWQPTIGRMVRFARLDSVPLCMGWTPAGDRLVTGCADGRLRVIDPDSARLLVETVAFEVQITSLAVHPAGASVAVGSRHGQVKLLPLPGAQDRSD